MGRDVAAVSLAAGGSSCAILDLFAVVQIAGRLEGTAGRIAVSTLAMGGALATGVGSSFGIAVSKSAVHSPETEATMAEAATLGGVGIGVGIVTLGLAIADLATIPDEPEDVGAAQRSGWIVALPMMSRDGSGSWTGGLGAAGVW